MLGHSFFVASTFWTGLRVQELVSATLGDIGSDAQSELWLHVTGEGAQPGAVALPPLVLDVLDDYLLQRGLPVTRRRWTPSTPLVASLGPTGHGSRTITPTRLRQITDTFFALAAARLVDDNLEQALRIRAASPRWLRHTHASHALENGVELIAVRDNLRHASISTTSAYLHGDDARRAHQVGAAFGRRVARR